MILFLWVLFVVLNGRLTLEIALFGAAIAAAVFMFMCAYLDWSLQKELGLYRRVPKLVAYFARLWVEIVKANRATLGRIYSRRAPRSAIVTLRPELKAHWQRQTLANSITLTPGTITLECDDERLVVHCLDESMAEGLEDWPLEEDIRKMEGEA